MTGAAMRGLVIGGGSNDPSLACLVAAARRLDVPVIPVLVDGADEPCLGWDLAADTMTVDGVAIDPAGLFLRYDVFTARVPGAELDRALGWYNTLLGWAAARPALGLFNREISPQAGIKPYQLQVARSLGLSIPATWIGNDLASARRHLDAPAIAKPVGGGAYVQPLAQALAGHADDTSRAPIPAIVQEQLGYPEYRVFVVGGDTHVFEIASAQLDYRPDPATRLDYCGPHGPIAAAVAGCQAVAAALRCDFAACDLKTRAGDSDPVFLEINTGPMFAAFDHAAAGAVTASIIGHLVR
ncbi:hypothetical protein [Sphingomonas bacterium]|uniref:ATP-grasp domain-containing protein n=1 Tax=Sphingomonas bacterium TaxID=1895847 RepID=UPI00260B7DCB|nr:hypothetical protein [Sphingomonas bacterium]MDB5677683.1 hypothetical protein [Sphingomonas bacterium]